MLSRLPLPPVISFQRALGLATLMLVLGLQPAASNAAPATLAVARSPLSLPIFVALAEGYFEAEGLTLTVVEAASGRRCLQLMATGQADLGTAAETAIAFESFDRSDFAIVATLASTSSDVELIARRAADIQTAAGLVGKKVGVIKGTSTQYFLDNFLLTNNVDPKSVTQVPIQPAAALQALASGQLDAVTLFQPLAYEAAHSPRVETVVLSDTGGYKQSFNLVVQAKFLGARPADVERLLRAVKRADDLIRTQPKRAEAILVARLGVAPAFAAWTLPRLHPVLSLDEALLRSLQSQVNWVLREGYANGRKPADLRSLVKPAPLLAVQPNAVGLPH